MSYSLKETVYFDSSGPQNTEETFRASKERAQALKIKDILVSSTTGETGVKASEVFEGFNLIVATHLTGWKEPDVQDMSAENWNKIKDKGCHILTCTHAFGGIERAIRNQLNTMYPIEIIANTLRLFGQGTKVAVEISIMAADAGLISTKKDVISLAGRSKGLDTALVVQPANSTRFFDLLIKEVIAKPRSYPISPL